MNGADLIAAERQRQLDQEGWTPEHDDAHTSGELADAALHYLAEAGVGMFADEIRASADEWPWQWWPWESAAWNPSDDPIRNLTKAGALIAAEIDRLRRAS